MFFSRSKKDKPLISVVVPVFNGEKYLFKCIESIASQSLKNIEIIILNDGSEDRTEEIAAKFCEDDERIKLFSHKKNKGLFEARKSGFSHSSGSYIFAADSDDFLADASALDVMYKNALETGADIVHCCCDFIYPEGIPEEESIGAKAAAVKKKAYVSYPGILEGEALFSECFEKHDYAVTLWAKLIKRELYEKAYRALHTGGSHIFLNEELIYFPIAFFAQKYLGLPDKFYSYSWGTGDSSSDIYSLEKWKKLCSSANIFPALYDFCLEYAPRKRFSETVRNLEISGLMVLLTNYQVRIDSRMKEEAWDILCETWGSVKVHKMAEMMNLSYDSGNGNIKAKIDIP